MHEIYIYIYLSSQTMAFLDVSTELRQIK